MRYLAFILAAITSAEMQAFQLAPRLVVNITIDQLRTDYIDAFTPSIPLVVYDELCTKGWSTMGRAIHSRLWTGRRLQPRCQQEQHLIIMVSLAQDGSIEKPFNPFSALMTPNTLILQNVYRHPLSATS